MDMTREPIFKLGNFDLHSGSKSNWKIDCSSLTEQDWKTLAYLISKSCRFGAVYGIPSGGLELERHLHQYITEGPVLIVDDVLTTGTSFEEAKSILGQTGISNSSPIGYVVFARGQCPGWVRALFQMEVVDSKQPNWDEIDRCPIWKALGVTECNNCDGLVKCWGTDSVLPEEGVKDGQN